MKVFGFRCLCLGVIAFSAVSMRAEKIKVTFDAGKYKKAEDWRSFIIDLYRALEKTPKREKSDTFLLEILNGNIFATVPEALENNFTGEEEQKAVLSMLGNVSKLDVTVSKFSTQSLETFFKNVKVAHLKGTEKITGEYEKCTLFLEQSLDASSDWHSLIDRLCERFMQYADDKRVLFDVKFKNGDIFVCDPGDVNYEDYYTQKEEPTNVTKILSKVHRIEVDAKVFSTLSLMKVFLWTRELKLPNAKYILGCSQRTSRAIFWEELKSITSIFRVIPDLRVVSAPKVTTIANGAFWTFRRLQAFNHCLPADTPTIVCTPLAENYFTQRRSPKNAVVPPVKVRNIPADSILEKYEGKSVEIGACAFENCWSLEHVSARASFIGSAAFAGSGLKSAHLLISRPVCEEYATLGDDVFFDCFRLKECFMMAGETCAATVDSAFDGCFWNCFSLETVCMPNINFCRSSSFRHSGEYAKEFSAIINPLALMFANCFSLKRIDLRSFKKNLIEILPYWLVRHNLKKKFWWDDVDKQLYYGVLMCSENRTLLNSVYNSYPKDVKRYVNLCLKDAEKKPFEPFQDPGAWKFNNCKDKENPEKQEIYRAPYCDIKTVFKPKKDGSWNSHLRVWHTIYETDVFSYKPGESFYDENMCENEPAFSRFNDVCMKWFVQKESLPEERKKQEDPFEEGKARRVKRPRGG